MVDYSYEQKGYKYYNPRTKQVRVSQDVIFDDQRHGTCLRLQPPNSNLITKDESSETETNREEEEVVDFGTLGESLISFRLSGSNERLSWND